MCRIALVRGSSSPKPPRTESAVVGGWYVPVTLTIYDISTENVDELSSKRNCKKKMSLAASCGVSYHNIYWTLIDLYTYIHGST